jgi:hypothetical protein
MHSNFQ